MLTVEEPTAGGKAGAEVSTFEEVDAKYKPVGVVEDVFGMLDCGRMDIGATRHKPCQI